MLIAAVVTDAIVSSLSHCEGPHSDKATHCFSGDNKSADSVPLCRIYETVIISGYKRSVR